MYNHARTLLLNLPGSDDVNPDHLGDELIPLEYNPVRFPSYLQAIRSRLFGADPDKSMLNYRAHQLLSIVASTKLQDYVTALDPRLTYGAAHSVFNDINAFKPKVTSYAGTGKLEILGSPISPDSSGKMYYSYDISLINETYSSSSDPGEEMPAEEMPAELAEPITENKTVTGIPTEEVGGLSNESPYLPQGTSVVVNVVRQTSPLRNDFFAAQYANQLTVPIPLPFSGYQFVIYNPAQNLNSRWTVRGYLQPTASLSDIFEGLKSIGEPYLLQLFGVSPTEPYLTFYNCWKNHPEFAYRMSGMLLAMIYRTEELRNE